VDSDLIECPWMGLDVASDDAPPDFAVAAAVAVVELQPSQKFEESV
jgi:hypothetical protein